MACRGEDKMNLREIIQELRGIRDSVANLEVALANITESHAPPKPKAKPKPRLEKKPDNLILREQNEKNPVFTDAELWEHQENHKKRILPRHRHKASTVRQFNESLARGVAKKEIADRIKVTAGRASQKKENEDLKHWLNVLNNKKPQKVKVGYHPRYPKGPYGMVTWEPPKWDDKAILDGYVVEINGSSYPLRNVNLKKQQTFKPWVKGSKVRVGASYSFGRYYGIAWSCYIYFR